MPFMLLLAITTGIARRACFHYSPYGVPAGRLSAVAAFSVFPHARRPVPPHEAPQRF
ncbi:MAG TPA: hypothetical protein VF859_01320 [Burkholderiales bacterium]